MSSRRIAKAAEAIREAVSSAILMALKDPRVQGVTVTGVEVTSDLRSAKVHVSIMGDEPTQIRSLRGLKSASGFLQSKVADRLQTRYTPVLRFVVDPGVKQSFETERILRHVLDASQPPTSDAPSNLTHDTADGPDAQAPR